MRKKNQVNVLVKILADFAVSTIAYFFIGYTVVYGVGFYADAKMPAAKYDYRPVTLFVFLPYAAAIPAIPWEGIAKRAQFAPRLFANGVLVGLIYSPFEESPDKSVPC